MNGSFAMFSILKSTIKLESRDSVVFSFPHGSLRFFFSYNPPRENNKRGGQLLDYSNIKKIYAIGN